MNNDKPRELFQAAYDKANLELERIHHEFERLAIRHKHVARVVEVLRPKSHFDGHIATAKVSLTSRTAGLTVGTRLKVMEKRPEA
jgi:hypothetical protein